MDLVFKALADSGRRRLLDSLQAKPGQMLSELSGHLDMSRQAVSKHLGVLQRAKLVAVQWRGREKHHFLNAAPIHEIYDRWIGKHHRQHLAALSALKQALEESQTWKPRTSSTSAISSPRPKSSGRP